MRPMRAEQFFAQAIHATADYDAALLLTLLATLGAAETPVRSTLKRLTADLSGVLTRSQVWRAANRLAEMDLLRLRIHPKTWTEYHVDPAALVMLRHRSEAQVLRLEELVRRPVLLPPAIASAMAQADGNLLQGHSPTHEPLTNRR